MPRTGDDGGEFPVTHRSESESEHQPVLVDEAIAQLLSDPNGCYFDLTVGLGGHLLALADQLGPSAQLVGYDRDPDALAIASTRMAGRRHSTQQVRLIQSSFARVGEFAGEPGLVAGILLDLGLSSRQLNDAGRGFAFRLDGPLDMRFDREDSSLISAAQLIAQSTASELADIFFHYGEERHSRRFARAIEQERAIRPITSTADLVAVLEPLVPFRERNRTLARLFQALRIAVNRELEQVEQVLPVAISLLKCGGRLAVITYHSLEDRIVKQFFRTASGQGGGKYEAAPPALVRILTKKPIEPSEVEITRNNRARSARLRVVERI